MRLPWQRQTRTAAAEAYASQGSIAPDTPWREVPYAVVDLEMTGLDPRRDEIISFASVPVEEGRILSAGARTTLVRPQRMPTEETIRVHGLRTVDLESAPPLSDAIDVILDALTGRVLVAHPSWVERSFLSPALRTAGVTLAEPVLCTAKLSARALGKPDADPPLALAARLMNLPVHSPHDAAGDALTTAQLLLAAATRLDAEETQTLESLARYSAR